MIRVEWDKEENYSKDIGVILQVNCKYNGLALRKRIEFNKYTRIVINNYYSCID